MAVGRGCCVRSARIPGLALRNARRVTQSKRARGRTVDLGRSQFSLSFQSGRGGRDSQQEFTHVFSGNEVVPARGLAVPLLENHQVSEPSRSAGGGARAACGAAPRDASASAMVAEMNRLRGGGLHRPACKPQGRSEGCRPE